MNSCSPDWDFGSDWDFSSLTFLEKNDDTSLSKCAFSANDLADVPLHDNAYEWSNNNAADDCVSSKAKDVDISLEAEFIETFCSADSSLPTSLVTLRDLLLHFPKLVYVVRSETSNEMELHFWRKQLLQALRPEQAKFPDLVFTSFERGLKHTGMEVTQSTHGGRKVKKWAIRKDWDSKPVRKTPKRKDKDDDVERPHKKLK
jgi:hypothetical protein